MKLSKLSDSCLKLMFNEYKNSGRTFFVFSFFTYNFPNENIDSVGDALRLLANDKLVKNSYGDDNPDTIQLELTTIRDIENDSKLMKVYSVLKEIKDWI